MFIPKREIEQLSTDVRRIIDGHAPDLRDNLEGRLSILKNDIHTLAGQLNEQASVLQKHKLAMANTLADISHQLKTPLTAMMVMAELLENAPPAKQTEFIANLKQGLVQSQWLVTSLLKMAKLESGTVSLISTQTTAKHIINLALQPLQILLDVKNQQVQILGDAAITCDENWTAEAFTNVIKNASEHSPEGSIIEISAGENPLCAWVSVTDTGNGITLNQIKTLFQRFTPAPLPEGGVPKGRGENTGIGLPLALSIMRDQNGDIEVDGGGNGRGATFTMKFYSRSDTEKHR